jgi:hypothetical protein
MTKTEQIAAAEKNLERLLEWVTRCDNKTVIILGIVTALSGVFVTLIASTQIWTYCKQAATVLTTLFLLLEFACIFNANIPRTRGPTGPRSLLFFETIAETGVDEYRKAFTSQTQDEYLADLTRQCHRNAQIVSMKFQSLTWAYRLLIPVLFFWAMSLYFLRV